MTQPGVSPVRAFVGLGSNLSGPATQLAAALEHIAGIPGTALVDVSGLYRSAPLGGIEQPEFLNAVALLTTSLDPYAMLDALKAVESAMGRDRSVRRWGPRNIDLDLLVFGDRRIHEPELSIPHPGIGSRNFVLLPLRDLDPELVVPGLGNIETLPIPTEPGIERISDRLWHTSA